MLFENDTFWRITLLVCEIIASGKSYERKRKKRRSYRSFIGMDMTSKYNVNFVLDECFLVYCSHGFTFHIMTLVTVIRWGMHYNTQPWCLTPINLLYLLIEPAVLGRVITLRGKVRRKKEKIIVKDEFM